VHHKCAQHVGPLYCQAKTEVFLDTLDDMSHLPGVRPNRFRYIAIQQQAPIDTKDGTLPGNSYTWRMPCLYSSVVDLKQVFLDHTLRPISLCLTVPLHSLLFTPVHHNLSALSCPQPQQRDCTCNTHLTIRTQLCNILATVEDKHKTEANESWTNSTNLTRPSYSSKFFLPASALWSFWDPDRYTTEMVCVTPRRHGAWE